MKKIMLAGLATLLLLTGCESLRRIGLSIERPTATVSGVSVSRLDFREAELTAEILVDNPNAVGITITGFTYTLIIEGVEFLAGTQTRGVSIPAFGERAFEFPVAVGFRNVVDTVGAVGDRDEANYTLDIDLSFELPVLGDVTVPVRREGTFPIVRPPTVRVADLVLDSLTVSGARLSLSVEVENPNGTSGSGSTAPPTDGGQSQRTPARTSPPRFRSASPSSAAPYATSCSVAMHSSTRSPPRPGSTPTSTSSRRSRSRIPVRDESTCGGGDERLDLGRSPARTDRLPQQAGRAVSDLGAFVA